MSQALLEVDNLKNTFPLPAAYSSAESVMLEPSTASASPLIRVNPSDL